MTKAHIWINLFRHLYLLCYFLWRLLFLYSRSQKSSEVSIFNVRIKLYALAVLSLRAVLYVCIYLYTYMHTRNRLVNTVLFITATNIRSILWQEAHSEYRQTIVCFYCHQRTVEQGSASAAETDRNFIWT